jgi:hypothetical protein
MLNYKLNILVISIKSSEHNNNDKKKKQKNVQTSIHFSIDSKQQKHREENFFGKQSTTAHFYSTTAFKNLLL